MRIINGDCLEVLKTLEADSIDSIVTDPPYAEVNRDYGRLTEQQWFDLMIPCIEQFKRILKPTGSAMMIIQPNSERCGKMRAWVWKFMVYCCENWNVIQDCYWWNFTTLPTGCATTKGLLRPSIKYIVWVGNENFYRNQDAILWSESESNAAHRLQARANVDRFNKPVSYPFGSTVNKMVCAEAAERRGGVTPFNLLPYSNTNSVSSAGAFGHGAGTPEPLCDWMIRYITPDNGVVLDPFMGSGTTGSAAIKQKRNISFIGIEKEKKYFEIAEKRISAEMDKQHQFQLLDN